MTTGLSRRRLLTALGATAGGALLLPDWTFLLRSEPDAPVVSRWVPVMGTAVTLVARHPDRRHCEAAMAIAVRDLFDVHGAMTRHEPSPLTSMNHSFQQGPAQVPEALLTVLDRSRGLHGATDGLFNATIGSLTGHLVRPGGAQFPAELARAGGGGCSWEHVEVDSGLRTVRLNHPETRLDLDGVAKGYAVDRAARTLRQAGIEHFLINAGGDIYAAGRPNGEAAGWSVQVSPPTGVAGAGHTLILSDRAVATSGNGFRPRNEDNEPIPHLFHPQTQAARTRWFSATALADTTLQADAWATAAFVGESTQLERLTREHSDLKLLLMGQDGTVVALGA